MKPILFNTEMVKAILDGRKTNTRRCTLKHIEILGIDEEWQTIEFNDLKCIDDGAWGEMSLADFIATYSKYQIGDILWVREPAKVVNSRDDKFIFYKYLSDNKITKIQYPERFTNPLPKWISECKGIPNGCIKEMARIFLKVTNVRVERLQDISLDDCEKEVGIRDYGYFFNKFEEQYNYKVDRLNNPYVFVYEFERIENAKQN